MQCPVARAAAEIRGGDIYTDDNEESTSRLIKIGGVEYVFDDAAFYIMSRKMELARFELRRPSPAQIVVKCKNMFVVPITRGELYYALIDKIFKNKYVYTQFIKLVDLLGEMEGLIYSHIEHIARNGQPVNISLPDITLLPFIDQLITYRPDILCATMNKIIDYVNRINISAIVKITQTHIAPMAPFSGELTRSDEKIEFNGEFNGKFDEKITIDDMKKMLDIELEIASYIRTVEEYHCDVINHMNNVVDACESIIGALSS
jgi:hypothetical protein